jgi:hypothetical protein
MVYVVLAVVGVAIVLIVVGGLLLGWSQGRAEARRLAQQGADGVPTGQSGPGPVPMRAGWTGQPGMPATPGAPMVFQAPQDLAALTAFGMHMSQQMSHLVNWQQMGTFLQQFGVNIDPERLKNATVMAGPMTTIQVGPQVVGSGGQVVDEAALRENGVAGQGRVSDFSPLGVNMNGQTLMQVGLDVTMPGQSPFHVVRHTFVPDLRAPSLAAGTVVPVKVDPADHQKIAIDWV